MVQRFKTINVIGLGYIGLPTAAVFARAGYKVVGVDNNKSVVDQINKYRIHISEPDLDSLVNEVLKSGNLTVSLEPTISDVFIICVPTPLKSSGNAYIPDLDYVFSALDAILPMIRPGNLVILESTCPVGTTDMVFDKISKYGVEVSDIFLAYCPERVLPGHILNELVTNDRVVGGISSVSAKVIADFYRTIIEGEVFETTARLAEMCKLAENSYRDLNIAYANELSLLCSKQDIDVWQLIELANRHPRVNILQPGVGVGGHCIAIDPYFLIASDQENTDLIRSSRRVNNKKPIWVVEKILDAVSQLSQSVIGRRVKIACLGVTFKPDVDDCRESPAMMITRQLKNFDVDVVVVDPNVCAPEGFDLISLNEALEDADLIAVLVRHSEFVESKKDLQAKNTIDFCGALS